MDMGKDGLLFGGGSYEIWILGVVGSYVFCYIEEVYLCWEERELMFRV